MHEELDEEFSDRDKENSYVERNNTQRVRVKQLVTWLHTYSYHCKNGMLKLQFKFNLLCVCHGNIVKDQKRGSGIYVQKSHCKYGGVITDIIFQK